MDGMDDIGALEAIEREVEAWLTEWGEDSPDAREDARLMVEHLHRYPPPELPDGRVDFLPFIVWACGRFGLPLDEVLERAKPFVEVVKVPD